MSGSPRKQSVFWINGEFFRCHCGRLSIRRAKQDLLLQRLDVPATLNQLAGEPIEKLRMARRFALRAKILAGLDEANTEELLPDAVDGNPREQWMIGSDQPLG